MKRTTILALFLALMLGGCVDDFIVDGGGVGLREEFPNLIASLPAEEDDTTRTYVEEGKYLRWHESDLITAFLGTCANRQYEFSGATGDNSGTFWYCYSSGDNVGADVKLDAIYAVYPYADATTIDSSGIISLTLPATQTYAEKSFGIGANTMVAVTSGVNDMYLGFKNVGGYVRLKLYGEAWTVKSITLKGNNGEKLAGAATVAMEHGGLPDVTMLSRATNSVTLDCGDGVEVGTSAAEATEFWIVLPEVTFEKGFTITVTDSAGKTFSKRTTNEVAIVRNTIQGMSPLSLDGNQDDEPAIPNNEIWYTSKNGEVLEPYSKSGFGANIVSNTYENGKGVITFDGDVTTIAFWSFFAKSNLTSIILPESVTTIDGYAFYSCRSLADIIIPAGVTTIEDYAFAYCDGLQSVTIGESVTSLATTVFEGCPNLREFRGKYALSDGSCLIIDDCLCVAAQGYNFADYVIPDGVTKIGYNAFRDCDLLTSVVIPASVTTIEDYAFAYCGGLQSVTIGEGVKTIAKTVFEGCSNLREFRGKYASSDGSCLIIDGALVLFAPMCAAGEVVIPEGVTSISSNAFYDCDKLTSVILPDSVTSIGSYAFYYCNNLEEIYLPNSITNIDMYAFNYCTSLKSVTIPEGITIINKATFWHCEGLESVTLPAGLKVIEYDAFSECHSLTHIDLPDGLTTIGRYAFNYCHSLNNVVVPDSVTSLGYEAFHSCTSLENITIGAGVESVGMYAFEECESLMRVYFKPTTPPAGSLYMFDLNPEDRKIYVPMESVEAYKSAEYWSEYADSIVGYDFSE